MLRGGLAAVGVGIVMIACSTKTESASSGFANEYCGMMAPCCANAGRPDTMRDCASALSARANFDQAKGDACLAAVRAKQNDPSFCDTAFANQEACKGVFGASTGSAKPGQACSSPADCATDPRGKVRCIQLRPNSPRFCQLVIEGNEGDGPCTGTRDGLATHHAVDLSEIKEDLLCDRANGIYCDESTWTCTKLAELGQPCKDDDGCVKTAACAPHGPATNLWICVPRVEIGGMCIGDNIDSNCVEGARCDFATVTCVALKEAGSFCMHDTECTSRTCSNGKCAATDTASAGLVCDSQ